MPKINFNLTKCPWVTNLRRKVWVENGPPPQVNLPKDEKERYDSWRNNTKFIFPNLYTQALEQSNYLAAFLLACNLIEFHLSQYLFEISYKKTYESFKSLPKCFYKLPKVIKIIYLKYILVSSHFKDPDYFFENEFTLGNLIRELEKRSVDRNLIDKLNEFNGRRNFIVHKQLYLKSVNKNVEEECKKACELASNIWERIKNYSLGIF